MTIEPSNTGADAPERRNPLFIAGTVLLLLVSAALAVLRGSAEGRPTAYQIGAVVGTLAVPIVLALVVYGVARLMGKGRTRAVKIRIVFYAVAVLLVLNVLYATGKGVSSLAPGAAAITDSERHGLEIGADSIRHRAFGFVLPHPGLGAQPDTAAQRRIDSSLAGHPDMAAWVLRTAAPRGSVIIEVVKDPRLDESRFRTFAEGVRHGSNESNRLQVIEDSLTWRDATGEYRLVERDPTGVYLRIRCLPRLRAAGPVVVCVQTIEAGADSLAFVRYGFGFPKPR